MDVISPEMMAAFAVLGPVVTAGVMKVLEWRRGMRVDALTEMRNLLTDTRERTLHLQGAYDAKLEAAHSAENLARKAEEVALRAEEVAKRAEEVASKETLELRLELTELRRIAVENQGLIQRAEGK